MGMRTIWISLRAMNYTDQAFRASIQNIEKLEKGEKALLNQRLQALQVARLNVQTGVLYAATTAMVAQQVFNLLNSTQEGSQYMSEFNQTVQELKVAFADTLFEALKPFLDVFKSIMEFLKNTGPLRSVIVYVGLFAGGLFALYSVYLILRGAMAQHNANLALTAYLTQMAEKYNISMTATNTGLAFSFKSLALSVGLVTAGLAIFMMIGQVIGKDAGIIVAAITAITVALLALAVAMNIVSVGSLTPLQLGAFAAGAGLAAGVMAMQGSYAVGTRSLPYTGMFLGHKGEVVYNPSTNRPAGVQSDLRGEGSSTTIQDIDIHVGTINTKTDVDDMEEKMGRTLFKAVKGSR